MPQHPTDALEAEASRAQQQPSFYLVPDEEEEGASEGGSASGDDWVPTEEGAEDEAAEDEEEEYGARAAKRAKAAEARSRKPGKRKGGFVVDSDEEDEEEEEEEEEFEAEDEDSESDSGEGYAPAPPRKKKPQAPKPAPRAKARASAALEPQWTESRRAPPPRAATFRVRPNYAEASESEPEASASEPAWPARPRAASGGGARHAPPAPARLSRARGSRSDLRQTSDSESGSEAAGGSGAPRRPAPACLLPEEETAYLEEEIERVVGHREPPEDSADVLQRGGLALEDGLAPGADGKLGAGADGKLDAGADGKLGAGADGKLAAGADPEPSAPSSSRPFAPLTRPWSELEFRIKWARQSYRECTWRSHASLASSRGFKKVLNYAKRADERAAWARAATPEELELAGVSAAMEEELVGSYERVERVVAARWSLFEEEVEVGEEELPDPSSQPSSPACPSSSRAPQPHRQYLVKWQGLPYAEATWESATSLGQSAQDREAVEAYRQRRARESEARVSVTAARRAFAGTGKRALEAQPDCLRGGRLRDYQLQGLNWMTYCWSRDANAILADEMGLGKTVQCASLLGYLFEELRLAGPALVVVPLSVAANWAREFRTWTPQLNAVLYIGDAASRAVIRAFELRGVRDMGVRDPGVDWARVEERLSREDAAAAAPPDVLLTTYELALKDADLLRGVRWNYFMVDEAHRLKNEGSALYRELSSWRLANKLLITGTPLQNSLRELWALLTFLTPGAWGEPDAFAETYDAASPDAVARLHAALRPCLLRRVIREVERSLPPKTERVLKVGMTPLQKQYYRWILTRNFAELNKGARGGQVTLLNVIMDLKKCCNHPFLFESAEENYRRSGSDADTQVDVLARTSGKLALLDRLLARLKADGHRVLVFSQMVRMLDILADYCRLRGYSAQRLDGSTPAAARASAMERFNAPGSPDFIFLLSTRAGGLGINLATADTVVIFDSDWNPQNDLQAMSRAHRIGQKGAVAIYRFVTAATVEESILERAKSKMMLDDVVIQRMDTSGRTVLQPDKSKAAGGMFGKDELAAILRCGAAQLFGEGKDEGAKQEEAEEPRQGGLSQGGPTSQALVTEDDLDAILQRAEVLDEASRAQDLGSHMLDGFSNVSTFASEETDADFWKKLIPEEEQRKARQAAADEEEEPLVRTARLRALEALGADPGALTLGAKRKLSEEAGGRERLVNPPLPGCQVRIDFWPACSHSDDDPHPPTLSRRDAGAFARAVRRHLSPNRLDAIAEESGGKVRGCSAPALLRLYKELLRGCQEAADQVQARGGNAADARLDWFGSEVRCQELVALCSGMARLEAKLRQAESSGNAGGFALGPHEMPAPTQWMRGCGWGPSQDAALILGIHLHGLGHWERLAEDPTLGLGGFLAAAVAGGAEAEVPSLPKPSHLETRAQALLRQLDKVARREALPPRPRAASGRRGSGAGRGREASREPGKESRREPGKESRREPGRESRREPDRESRKEAVKDSRMEAAKAEASQPPRKTPAARPAAQLPGGSHGMTREQGVAVLGKECMTWVGKLRTLQRLGSEMPEQRLLLKSRKYLHAIGAGVRAACAGGEEDEARLWAFVSSYTGNSMDGAELAGVYKRLPAGSSEKEA